MIPPGYTDQLRRAMEQIHDKANVRLRFVGHTRSERLDRRTALVYGDDVGLSAARARRAMEKVKGELALSDSQVEHEGRGYVHSDDVVNSGFVEGESSDVQVEVVFDDLAVLDNYEGVDVTPLTREIRPKSPLGLNLMRITVDGEPIDDPGRSSEDIQRCTDVALDRANIRFGFDNLRSERRLGVSASPSAIQIFASAGDETKVVAHPLQGVQQLRGLHRPLGDPDLRARPVAAVHAPRRPRRGNRRLRRVAARSAARSRRPCASSRTSCAPTTRRATSTRPRPSRFRCCTTTFNPPRRKRTSR